MTLCDGLLQWEGVSYVVARPWDGCTPPRWLTVWEEMVAAGEAQSIDMEEVEVPTDGDCEGGRIVLYTLNYDDDSADRVFVAAKPCADTGGLPGASIMQRLDSVPWWGWVLVAMVAVVVAVEVSK